MRGKSFSSRTDNAETVALHSILNWNVDIGLKIRLKLRVKTLSDTSADVSELQRQ